MGRRPRDVHETACWNPKSPSKAWNTCDRNNRQGILARSVNVTSHGNGLSDVESDDFHEGHASV